MMLFKHMLFYSSAGLHLRALTFLDGFLCFMLICVEFPVA